MYRSPQQCRRVVNFELSNLLDCVENGDADDIADALDELESKVIDDCITDDSATFYTTLEPLIAARDLNGIRAYVHSQRDIICRELSEDVKFDVLLPDLKAAMNSGDVDTSRRLWKVMSRGTGKTVRSLRALFDSKGWDGIEQLTKGN